MFSEEVLCHSMYKAGIPVVDIVNSTGIDHDKVCFNIYMAPYNIAEASIDLDQLKKDFKSFKFDALERLAVKYKLGYKQLAWCLFRSNQHPLTQEDAEAEQWLLKYLDEQLCLSPVEVDLILGRSPDTTSVTPATLDVNCVAKWMAGSVLYDDSSCTLKSLNGEVKAVSSTKFILGLISAGVNLYNKDYHVVSYKESDLERFALAYVALAGHVNRKKPRVEVHGSAQVLNTVASVFQPDARNPHMITYESSAKAFFGRGLNLLKREKYA